MFAAFAPHSDRKSGKVRSILSKISSLIADLIAAIRSAHHIRVWYGFGMFTMMWMLLKHGRGISPWRVVRLLPFIWIGSFNTCVGVLSRLIYSRKIRQTRLHPSPLIILGHWRTGTTYLHELLCCDKNFNSPNGYQCGAPHIFFFTELSFRKLFRFFVPKQRPMDNMAMDLDRPQEEEFALLGLLGRSIYSSFVFPASGPIDSDYLSLRSLDAQTRRRWLDTWVYFLKSVALRNPEGSRFVLKTPQHTARIRTILSEFPEAKFVHIVRNPLSVHASTLRLWNSMIETHGLSNADAAKSWLSQYVLSTFEEMYECFEQDRHLIPKGNLIEVSYEQLAADPKAVLRQIYEALDLGAFSQVEQRFEARLSEARIYRPNIHKAAAAEDLAAIRSRWAWYIKQYGYEDQVAEQATANGEAAASDGKDQKVLETPSSLKGQA